MSAKAVRRLVVCGLVSVGCAAATATAAATAASPGEPPGWGQFQSSATHAGISGSASLRPPLAPAWRRPYGSGSGEGVSGPVVAGGLIVVAGVEHVYAVDPATGQLAKGWPVRRDGGPIVTPAAGAVHGRAVVVYTEGSSSRASAVVAVDLATRRELWRRPLKGVSTSGVTISDGQVILGDRSGNLYAFDLATGTPATWSPTTLGTGGLDAPPAATSSAIVGVVRDLSTGSVSVAALDRNTGHVAWTYAPRLSAGTGSAVSIDGDLALFGIGQQQEVRAVSLRSRGTADTVWSTRTRSTFSPLSAPAVAEGTVFILSTTTANAALYALDASDGGDRWDFQFQTPAIQSSPVVAGHTVFVGTEDGSIVGIDAASGVEVWKKDTGAGAIGPLAIAGDELVASKRGVHGGLIAFRPNPGGRLLHIESPTKLRLGTDLARYGIALAVILLVALGGGTLVRRRSPAGPPPPPEGLEPDAPTATPEGS